MKQKHPTIDFQSHLNQFRVTGLWRQSQNRFKKLPLNKPAGAVLTICELEDTEYKEKLDEVSGWGNFYLRDIVNMRVVGVVEGTSCPVGDLVLLTCEDKQLYGYDGEELHVVAPNLPKAINDKKIDYPASESYYNDMVRNHNLTWNLKYQSNLKRNSFLASFKGL
uniref:Uncharacterized protein n=1 Tax=Salarias fasciatus TaxID=181472 RepID=A0A672GT73_SALFA